MSNKILKLADDKTQEEVSRSLAHGSTFGGAENIIFDGSSIGVVTDEDRKLAEKQVELENQRTEEAMKLVRARSAEADPDKIAQNAQVGALPTDPDVIALMDESDKKKPAK